MKRDDVVTGLVVILKEVLSLLGEEVEEIEETVRPIGGFAKFDSLVGVEVTGECLERFDLDETTKIVSLFEGNDKHGRPYALTVGQIADKIVKLQSVKGK